MKFMNAPARITVVVLGLTTMVILGLAQTQPTAPDELVALTQQVVVQLEMAQAEASLAWIAPTFADVQVSTQRMLNILVGKDSADYGEVGNEQSEIDIGLLDNLLTLREQLADTAWADFAITADALHTFIGWAQEQAKAVLELDDEELARVEIHKAEAFIRAAIGCMDALPTNGGAKTILKALEPASVEDD